MPRPIWTPQAAYDQHGDVHRFTPENTPLLCILDRTRTVLAANGQVIQERRNLGRLDVWTGREWVEEGEGTGRYHSLFQIPSRRADCWVEGSVPLKRSHYLILCRLCNICNGSYWRIEAGYYVAQTRIEDDGLLQWRVFRRKNRNEREWANIPNSAVMAWTELPRVEKPSV